MPEFYTFITEPKESTYDVEQELNEYNIPFHVFDTERGKVIAGSNFEEDCGYPVELTIVFSGSGIRCVYCNNNEYGIIDGSKNMKLFDTTLQ